MQARAIRCVRLRQVEGSRMADKAMTDTPGRRRTKVGNPVAKRASDRSLDVDDIFCRGTARCRATPRRYDEELENDPAVPSSGSTRKPRI